MALVDLNLLEKKLQEEIPTLELDDIEIPVEFKNKVSGISDGNSIHYNSHTIVFTNRDGQKIFFPNQCFFVASCLVELYSALMDYKNILIEIFGSQKIKSLLGREDKISPNELKAIDTFPGISDWEKVKLKNFLTNFDWWKGGKNIGRDDFWVSPVLATANVVNTSQSLIADFVKFLHYNPEYNNILKKSFKDFTPSIKIQEPIMVEGNIENIKDSPYLPYLAAIRTKPFILLAGISGTGKSRIVRELARACWPKDDTNRKKQIPENFAMVAVKPNWHDSSEFIGYVSNINGSRYIYGDFLRFVVKAWTLTKKFGEGRAFDMPCFLCLDEMNLAPVEQYFAEYLSCIESRSIDEDTKRIVTDPILQSQGELIIEEEEEEDDKIKNILKEINKAARSKEDWYPLFLVKILKEVGCPNSTFHALYCKFMDEGITLPPNLVVMGTVNMDETTFAFSRKVLDRAMTIEMNEVKLKAGLGDPFDEIPDLSDPQTLPLLGTRIKAEDIYLNGNGDSEEIKTMNTILGWLERVNNKLENTPFKIAYRTRNEIILFVINSMEIGADILTAFDYAVNMKILPRIEGDAKKVGDVLKDLKELMEKIYQEVIEGLAEEDEKSYTDKSPSINKLDEMSTRMERQFYCTYWS